MNWRLAPIIFTMASVVVTGVLMAAALIAGYDDGKAMMTTAAIGLLLSLPITYVVTRQLSLFTLSQQKR